MTNIAFLDRLATARSESEFALTAAGLTLLQVYDSIKTHGFDPFIHADALANIQRDIDAITVEAGVRPALESVIQALPFWETSGVIRIGRRASYTALLVYGQALGDEGEWHVATAVYNLVAIDAELDGETWLAAESRLLMGRACRMCADWETSQTAYRRAYQLGRDARDLAIALRARIGEANNLWGRGDFPGAKRLLAITARHARKSCPSIVPRVMLATAGLANAAGEYERAIQLAFALQNSLPDDDELKYQTLVDLAIFLTDYGLPPVAAAALQLVEHSSPEPRIRRQATLNLFFLAAHYEDETAFDKIYKQLGSERLTAREQTQLALFAAHGLRRFSRFDAAQSSAERALQLANQFELFQLVFEAEAELHAIENTRSNLVNVDAAVPMMPVRSHAHVTNSKIHVTNTRYRSTTGGKLPPRIRRVAESLESMARQFATADAAPSVAL